MKKLFSVLVIALLIVALVAACGTPAAPTPTPAPPADTTDANGPSDPSEGERWHPTRDMTALIGFGAGGGMDFNTRLLIPGLQEELGVNIIPTNMPGANGAISLEDMMSRDADGYTIWAYGSGALTFPASGLSDFTYRDVQLLAITQGPNPVITVPINSPIETMEDFIEAILAGNTTAGNSGIGGAWHLPQLVIVDAIGGSTTYIPYDGGRATVQAVAQEEVMWGISDLSEAMAFITDGFVRPLAMYKEDGVYVDGFGYIPSIVEWIPEIEDIVISTSPFRAIAIRRGAPQYVVDTWIEALRVVAHSPEFRSATEAAYVDVLWIYGEEAEAMAQHATRIASWLMYDLGFAERSPEEVGVPRP